MIVAAFEPFGGRCVNRAWEAVQLMQGAVERVTLPVDFGALREIVPGLVRRADALLLCGEDSQREHVALEAVALNAIHARIPDNAGAQPRRQPVRPGGPLALAATWDVDAACAAAAATGIEAEVSHHAGTFACNAALYLALDAATALPAPPRIGFVHVPVKGPRLSALARAIEAVILTLEPQRGT